MNGLTSSGVLMGYTLRWPILFARDVDQDLDFDEGLEDDELGQHKPPSRRPWLWIIILFLAVGVVYWSLKPDFSTLSGMDSSKSQPTQPGLASSGNGESSSKSVSSSIASLSSPKFGEGQQVRLTGEPGEKSFSAKLKGNPSGTKPGPRVQIGELLTILDGEIVNDGWAYHVRTTSGETGWVFETEIKGKT